MAKRDKSAERWQLLLERTAEIFPGEDPAAILAQTQAITLRRNPLRPGTQPAWNMSPLPWCIDGYRVDEPREVISRAPEILAGQYFMQNASSWLPVLALDPQPNETILDACAAPGGKTSHLAALRGSGQGIVACDVSKDRLIRMRQLHKTLNVTGVDYRLIDARRLKQSDERFDKILLDAPCSGEADIKTQAGLGTWSMAKVKRLHELQKQLLASSWQTLKPGGTLMYSTCTFAPEENEAVLHWFLTKHAEAHLAPLPSALPGLQPALAAWRHKTFDPTIPQFARRVHPSDVQAGFFVAKLTKSHSPSSE